MPALDPTLARRTAAEGSAPPPTDSSAARGAAVPVFRARGLEKVYTMGEVRVRALDGVDLDLHEGELVVLLGPSGSGKSTLVNVLGGLDSADAGSLRYRGEELAGADGRTLTRYRLESVGFIFQFYNLIPGLTARENVALVTEIAPDPMTPDEALALVDMADRSDHFPAELSGGEQQRVAVARAIAKRPALLLCDEPTGALDIATGITVLEAIDGINREFGTTTVVITHNAVIGDMADRVVTLVDGRIAGERANRAKRAARELVW